MALLNESAHSYYSGNDLGSYQFISLDHVINNFLISHVGDNKIIGKAKRTDVAFHAQRALQEFSYDTFKSIKSQEITLPPSLTMPLPQDYVNYVKLTWVDSAGIEHIIYPTSKTSNPNKVAQDTDGNYIFEDNLNGFKADLSVSLIQFPVDLIINEIIDGQTSFNHSLHEIGFDSTIATGTTAQQYTPDPNPIKVGMVISSIYFPVGTTITEVINPATSGNGWFTFTTSNPANTGTVILTNHAIQISGDSDTWNSYKSGTPSENNSDDYEDDTYWPMAGERYGLDPQHAQANGSYYIDEISGKIHFSSNINGKTVILKYISDGLGTDGEMVVHKFAEEAMYKHIAYAMLSTRLNIPEQLVARFKKERFAETRKAKLRLSSIKLEELTQILRGKSKQIKH
tara:strand:- start:1227 stop:2423 length:1197 start_codon:yes stop_codon:yes gene_type:complete